MIDESKTSRFTLNQKLTIFALVMIVSLVSSPFVYALVEPHIKITMDVGQSTKPFQIVDDQNVEVFSVDTDGIIFPDQAGVGFSLSDNLTFMDERRFVIDFTQFPEINQVDAPADGVEDFNSFLPLATWTITFNSTSISEFGAFATTYPNPQLIFGYLHGYFQEVGTNQIHATQGTQGLLMFQSSFDQLDWDAQCGGAVGECADPIPLSISSTSQNYRAFEIRQGLQTFCGDRESSPSETCFVRLAWGDRYHNGNALNLKEVQTFAEIFLPVGATMVRTS